MLAMESQELIFDDRVAASLPIEVVEVAQCISPKVFENVPPFGEGKKSFARTVASQSGSCLIS